jgi:uncharacterized protein YecE (DUF72 family)
MEPPVRIGTCAWSFEDWEGGFYPPHIPSAQRLPWYARYLPTVEIDSTFYAAPAPATARHWLEVTPPEFVFSCKLPREMTHDRKLRGCRELLRLFLAGIEPLGPKLGAVLVQLPPYFHPAKDEEALREFVPLLPAGIRFAIEFRDPAWHLPRIAHLLEAHGVCWAWNDLTSPEHQAEAAFDFLPRTADFLYLRLMGDSATKYGRDGKRLHRYTQLSWPREGSLESWSLRVRQHFHEVGGVLVYVNNHFEGFSPATCKRLAERFGLEIRLPDPAEFAPPEDKTRQLELGL